jgi:hypothetical protein
MAVVWRALDSLVTLAVVILVLMAFFDDLPDKDRTKYRPTLYLRRSF